MTHKFEFVVVKKVDKEGDEPQVFNLVYQTKSNRKSKVRQLIVAELEKLEIIKESEMKEFYLRQLA